MGSTLTVKGKQSVCEICACANELFDFSPESGQSFLSKSLKRGVDDSFALPSDQLGGVQKRGLLLFRLPEDWAPCHRHVTAIRISNAENIGPMIMSFNCQSVANLATSSASAQMMYTCSHLHSDKILRWNAAIQLHNAHHRQPGPDFFFLVWAGLGGLNDSASAPSPQEAKFTSASLRGIPTHVCAIEDTGIDVETLRRAFSSHRALRPLIPVLILIERFSSSWILYIEYELI
eukprot:s2867_g1.t1